MRITLIAFMLLALTVPGVTTAQKQVSAATLQEAADKSKNALLSGTPEDLFNSLAPWLQERVKLHKLEEFAYLEAGRKENKDFAAQFAIELKERIEGEQGQDPAGLTQIKTLDDSLKSTPDVAFALDFGYYRVRGLDRLKDNLAGQWFVVDRIVGLEEEDGVSRTTGRVRYCSAGFRDSIEVRCVQDETGWQVVDITADFEDVRLSLAGGAIARNPLDSKLAEAAAQQETRADAEEKLRTMRDYARLHWSKNQQVAKSLTKDALVHEDALAGEWHTIRDEVYKQAGANRGAIVADPADEQDFMGWGIITFDYDGGQSRVTWYQTKEELEEALSDFQTED